MRERENESDGRAYDNPCDDVDRSMDTDGDTRDIHDQSEDDEYPSCDDDFLVVRPIASDEDSDSDTCPHCCMVRGEAIGRDRAEDK